MAATQKTDNPANITDMGSRHHENNGSQPNFDTFGIGQEEKAENSSYRSRLIEELNLQITRLSGHLSEEERKNRQLQDELFTTKRELAEGNAELRLNHKEEIRTLEKDYEARIRELEKEVMQLETDKRFDKLEYKNSNRDGMTRFLDMIEENGADFVTAIITQLQSAGQNPAQATPQQIQEAVKQQAQAQKAENSQNSENQETSDDVIHDSETNPTELTHEEQLMQAKEEIKQNLLDNALKTLANSDINIQEFAEFARAQIAIMRENNLSLDAQAWIEMARTLAQTAIEKNISVERVANIIKPLLDGVKGYGFMLKAMNPEMATEQLFNQFNVEASDEVKKLVSKVLEIIKQSL
ncbi:hypothetical protein [Gracilimonas sediminicola]|uniref:hypothetical protein n=1 Tax=Gracilimonas sediminicola TaxID=2952158 RepID=UPI0038D367AC